MTFWADAPPPPEVPPVGLPGWLRVLVRGPVLAVVTFGGLVLLLLIRLLEAPLCGVHRPVTPHITRMVCRLALRILGLRLRVRGTPMAQHGAIVANHASWLDIFTLNACDRFYFVAKAEVARWLFIGWLARATGTVFITRDGREAAAQKALFEARLDAGHRLRCCNPRRGSPAHVRREPGRAPRTPTRALRALWAAPHY
jgi:1-acyl-sn-glycerol-3-phosphate acyltransferase